MLAPAGTAADHADPIVEPHVSNDALVFSWLSTALRAVPPTMETVMCQVSLSCSHGLPHQRRGQQRRREDTIIPSHHHTIIPSYHHAITPTRFFSLSPAGCTHLAALLALLRRHVAGSAVVGRSDFDSRVRCKDFVGHLAARLWAKLPHCLSSTCRRNKYEFLKKSWG